MATAFLLAPLHLLTILLWWPLRSLLKIAGMPTGALARITEALMG